MSKPKKDKTLNNGTKKILSEKTPRLSASEHWTIIKIFDYLGNILYGAQWTGEEKNLNVNLNAIGSNYKTIEVLNHISSMISHSFFEVYDVNSLSAPLNKEQIEELIKEYRFLEYSPLQNLLTIDQTTKPHRPFKDQAFSDKFLVPTEQIEYVLSTGRSWRDQFPRQSGIIFSSGKFPYYLYPMIKVDHESSIINYAELKTIFEKKHKARHYEIDLWLLSSKDEDLCPLYREIESDGYSRCYTGLERNNYKVAFYHVLQIANFIPPVRLIEYKEVLNIFKQSIRYNISNDVIIDYIINEICIEDCHKIATINKLNLHNPVSIHSKNGLIYEDKKKMTKEQLIKFAEEALFDKEHVMLLKNKYFRVGNNADGFAHQGKNASRVKGGESKNKLAKDRITKTIISCPATAIKFKTNGSLNKTATATEILRILNNDLEEKLIIGAEIVRLDRIEDYIGKLSDGKKLHPDQNQKIIEEAKVKLTKNHVC